MSKHPTHETYIIHCWQEENSPAETWRFRLTIVSNGRTFGFTSAEALTQFWQEHLPQQPHTQPPTTTPPENN